MSNETTRLGERAEQQVLDYIGQRGAYKPVEGETTALTANGRIVPIDPRTAEQVTFFDAVVDNEFWQTDVTDNFVTALGNVAAQTVGLPGDLVDLWSLGMRGTKMPNSPLPNAEELAKRWGGDETHPSWLPASFIAPGPGEFLAGAKVIKSSILGLVGVRNLKAAGHRITSVDDFVRRETELFGEGKSQFDFDLWKETGYYRAHDGKIRFVSYDQGKINPQKLAQNRVYKQARAALSIPTRNQISFQLRAGEVYDNPTLYAAYPGLENLPVSFNLVKTPEGTIRFQTNPLRTPNPKGPTGALTHGRQRLTNYISLVQMKVGDIPGEEFTDRVANLETLFAHELQHAVQYYEGFAKGASHRSATDMVRDLEFSGQLYKILNAIDAGTIKSNDDVIAWLSKNVGPRATENYINRMDKDLHRLVNKGLEFKQAGLHNEFSELHGMSLAAWDDAMYSSLHVAQMLADNGQEQRFGSLIEAMANAGGPFDDSLEQLTNRAYEWKYGEAEARLSEMIQKRGEQVKELAENMGEVPSGRIADFVTGAPERATDLPVGAVPKGTPEVTVEGLE